MSRVGIMELVRDGEEPRAVLRSLRLRRLFDRQELGAQLEAMREEWLEEYDVVLISSHAVTGYRAADSLLLAAASIWAIHLPDILVVLFPAQHTMDARRVLRRAVDEHAQLPLDRRSLVTVPVISSPASDFVGESGLKEFCSDWLPEHVPLDDAMWTMKLNEAGELADAQDGWLARTLGSLIDGERELRFPRSTGRKRARGRPFQPTMGGRPSGRNNLKLCVDQAVWQPARARGAIVPDRTWGDSWGFSSRPVLLQIGFMDGDPDLQMEVLRVASEWSDYANVQFVPSDRPMNDCDIRISFRGGGSWSYIGRDAMAISPDRPTMSLDLGHDSPQEEIRKVVLHQFGHALGLAHEHLQPAEGIPWNREKVYGWYEENLGWNRKMVDSRVFSRYDHTLTIHGEPDPRSVMLYPIPAELTDGRFHADMNGELSEADKDLIARMYPRAGGS